MDETEREWIVPMVFLGRGSVRVMAKDESDAREKAESALNWLSEEIDETHSWAPSRMEKPTLNE